MRYPSASTLVSAISLTLPLCLLSATALPATSGSTQKPPPSGSRYIAVFGDSMSDDGNLHAFIPSMGYWKGRFSNGPNWADYASAYTDRTLLMYATGGAVSDNALIPEGILNQTIPSLRQQVESFVQNRLYASSIFGNTVGIVSYQATDLFFLLLNSAESTLGERISKIVDSVVGSAEMLLAAGIPDVYVWNLPHNEIPGGIMYNVTASLNEMGMLYNGLLEPRVREAASKSGGRLHLVNNTRIHEHVMSRPVLDRLRITNTTGSCSLSVGLYEGFEFCSNPDNYYYYDLAHYTHHVNYVLGITVGKLLEDRHFDVSEEGILGIVDEFDIPESTAESNVYIDVCPTGMCQIRWL